MDKVIRILGVDPGSRLMGWGVVDLSGTRLTFVDAGVVKPPARAGHPERLAILFRDLDAIITRHQPDEAAVEETFVNASPRDALTLGQARGIALTVPALAGLPVHEYAANSIKKSVVGRGHADKHQVEAMIRVLLPGAGPQKADAADALAVAICHAHHRPSAILKQRFAV